MTSDNVEEELQKKVSRLERKAAREKSARLQAEEILEEKSRELYELNQRLSEEARLLEATVVNAKDGVIITKADLDNGGPEIIYVNDAFTTISGYTREEVIGKTPRILQGEDTSRDVLRDLKSTLVQGRSFQAEIKNYTKDGVPYWLDISIVPVRDEADNITHFAAIERDVTVQKEAQAELTKQKERAESANIAKSEFLANMSHELRTPMNAIIGMTEFLLDSKLDDEQRDNAETLHGSSRNLLSLLNDILDVSKIEAGELQLEYVPFHIGTAIQQMMQLFTPSANDKGIDLFLERDERVPSTVVADLGRIQQVLRNLMSNALKFTEEGSITIFLKTALENGEPYLFVGVQDTGIGIPEDKKSAIFEKFMQADTSVTREFGGTGLGLAITQQLIVLMGGNIGVDSIEGQGSTFWFTVPLDIADDDMNPVNLLDKEQYLSNIELSDDIRILAVDDHPINQKFVLKLLQKLGFSHADLAENGQDALDKIEANAYDIVLMDCQMPVLDGYQATTRLREIEQQTGGHLPVVALTANAMVGDREKCLKAGMDDYLSKPIQPDKLMELIKKYAGHVVSDIQPPSQESDEEGAKVEAPSDEPIIDLDHLELFTDGDPAAEKELLDLFFGQADSDLEDIEASCVADHNEDWKKATHKMKGASANLGAHILAAACADAEERFEDTVACKEAMLAEIKNKLQDLRDFFAARL